MISPYIAVENNDKGKERDNKYYETDLKNA